MNFSTCWRAICSGPMFPLASRCSTSCRPDSAYLLIVAPDRFRARSERSHEPSSDVQSARASSGMREYYLVSERCASVDLSSCEISSQVRGKSAPGRTRTCDQVLRRHLLYPLSYGRLGTARQGATHGPALADAAVGPQRTDPFSRMVAAGFRSW